jgi:hypothetical protein
MYSPICYIASAPIGQLLKQNQWDRMLITTEARSSVTQKIVFRYQEIGGYCVRISEAMVLFLSKEYLDRNITFFPMLLTQFIPDFFVAEYYGLWTTIFWGS